VRGRTVDTNAAFLAAQAEGGGFQVRRIVVLGDEPRPLHDELLRCSSDSDLILLSGGLGPTADDRTRWAVAEAAGLQLEEDADTRAFLAARLASFGRDLDETQLTQAQFPAGSVILPNPRGTARGFACRVGPAWLVAMPGVPDEMRGMFSESVLPFLQQTLMPGRCVRVETLHLFPIAEPVADERIRDMSAADRNPLLGITTNDGVITLSVSARADDPQTAEALLTRDVDTLRERFGETVFGSGSDTLASALARVLAEHGVTIGIAESVTGGLVGHMLVSVPGISRFFLEDVVAYSNESKIRRLGVEAALIEDKGAVSPQVAEAMARGICAATGCDLGVSTTGIAGPDGGSETKPVGLAYVGVALRNGATSVKLALRGDRRRIKDRAAKHALNCARLALLHGVESLGDGRG